MIVKVVSMVRVMELIMSDSSGLLSAVLLSW